MLNPNSYAITAKNQWGIQTDRYLQVGPVGTLEAFGTLGSSEPLEPQNQLELWSLSKPYLCLEFAGTFTWNSNLLEPPNLLEPWVFGTSEPRGMTAPECPKSYSLAETPKLTAVGEKHCSDMDIRQHLPLGAACTWFRNWKDYLDHLVK